MKKKSNVFNEVYEFLDIGCEIKKAGINEIKIDAESVKNRVTEKLSADPAERKLYMKRKFLKTAAIAAALTAAFSVSVFASSPAGQETINSIISFFQNEKAVELTDVKALSMYNEDIGKSDTKSGYTLTLDNVAADSNFVHVFYTIKSEKPYANGNEYNVPGIVCRINGAVADFANNNRYESYFEDEHTYKGLAKYSIASMSLGDKIKLEIYTDTLNGGKDDVPIELYNRMYSTEPVEFTDAEKDNMLYISTEVDLAKVKVACIERNVNRRLYWNNSSVEKVVFSPFGNQLVMKTDAEEDAIRVDMFALYDENGKCLDVLNTGLSCGGDSGSVNTLEFLKADKDTKQLKFVPLINREITEDADTLVQSIGSYPITYDVSGYGKVVVTDVRFYDGKVEVDYYKDGFVIYDPGFILLDKDGENAEPGGKLGCLLEHVVHYDTNSYTAVYSYYARDIHGNEIPAGPELSADNLKQRIVSLETYAQPFFDLDFDNAVTVNLK